MGNHKDRVDVQVARGILIAVLGLAVAAVILWSVWQFATNA